MSETARVATRDARGRGALILPFALKRARLAEALREAYAQECALRRPALWLAVAAGVGVVLYFAADREPPLGLCLFALGATSLIAFMVRRHRRAHALFLLLAAIAGGYAAGAWRTARVAAPVLTRAGVGELTGFVEEIDLRRAGARFVLRVASAKGLPEDVVPTRVRLTTRGDACFRGRRFHCAEGAAAAARARRAARRI